MARTSRGAPAQRVRHKMEWAYATNAALGQDLTSVVPTAVIDLFTLTEPRTLRRLRGKVMVQLDAGAPDEKANIAMGIIVVNERALAVGVSAMPSPVADGGDDWIWYGVASVNSGTEAAILPEYLTDRMEIDSKAMRKLHADERIVFIIEPSTVVDQGGTFDFVVSVRALTSF